jgi:hypothetical protein
MKTSHRQNLSLWTVASLAVSALATLIGCGGISDPAALVSAPQTMHMSGSVHGGQQPVYQSNIYLYAVGTTQGGASTAMLTKAVQTDVNGDFSITNDYTCPSGTGSNPAISTYLLALGGNPGTSGTVSNSAIALMAALGPCSGLSASQYVQINEVTTAAAVTALQQFMVDSTHIGSATLNVQPGYSAVQNIPNAMTTANNLASIVTGGALSAPINGNGTSPQMKLNTLGNIIAACINSLSATSASCTSLFAATKPSGGAAPTDTIGAMLQIARNPGTNVSTLFSQSTTSAPFQPALSSAPNDFSLAISFTGGSLSYPGPIVIDNGGNVWIANCATCNGSSSVDSIVGFSPAGAINTSAQGYVTNVHKPVAIAIDRYNGIWVGNASTSSQGNQLTRLSNTDGSVEYPLGNNTSAPTVGFPVNLNGVPGGIALVEDNPADAWVTDTTNGAVSKIKYDGTILTSGLTTTGLANPTAIVADGLQNLYLVGTGSNSIVQYSAAGSFTSDTGGGLSSPVGLAADGGEHLWTVNQGSSKSISEIFGYTGTATSGTSGYSAGINKANNISIDGAGTAWIANCRVNCSGTGADNIVHLSATGASLLPSDGLQNATLTNPTATAIDISGNLWISSTGAGNMTEIVGVAVPVVAEMETASSRHALPATNYLVNGDFEAGAQVKGDSGTNAIPGWTYSSTTSTGGAAGVDNGSPFSGAQKLTFYNGSLYQVSESQTMTVPNGTYIVSCYVAGDPNHSSRTAALTATTNGASISNALANLNYNFQPYAVAGVVVINGSLTVSLNDQDTSGGYVGWDSCSVAQQ